MPADPKFLSESKSELTEIFRRAVKAVSPYEIIRRKVKFRDNALHIDGNSLPLRDNVYLVGFGKAVMGMGVELEKMLGNVLKKGIVSVPSALKDSIWVLEDKLDFPKLHSVIEYRVGGANNQPDERSLDTTHDIIDLVEKLTEKDSLIVLVSGGGSALLYMPRPILDEDDKLDLCKKLQNAGANITEVNTVRKKLSLVKGGGLARMAYPASVVTLILSDIIGDPVDLIASGPTVYSPKAPEHVTAVLKKYHLFHTLEGDLKTCITSKETFDDRKLLSPAKQFKHVHNLIIGNNAVALEAASLEAARRKLTPIILKDNVTGNVVDVSLAYVHVTSLVCLVLLNEMGKEEFHDKMRTTPHFSLSVDKIDKIYRSVVGNATGIVLIAGGEPTVVVTGHGKGGRNQELALRFSLDWLAKIKSYPRLVEYDVMMLSAGSDGQDGPTDAAGAFGYPAIAPVIHDAFAKVKSMTAKEIQIKQERETTDGTVPMQNPWKCNSGDRKTTDESASAEGNISERDRFALMMMQMERMLPENVLKENDTYNFYSRFKRGADLLKTGLTGTNVMDLHFVYIKKRSCKCEADVPDDKPIYEDIFDVHDLRIDTSTVERYKVLAESLKFDKDKYLRIPFVTTEIKEEKPYFDLKITDENFADPCCDKKCKFDCS